MSIAVRHKTLRTDFKGDGHKKIASIIAGIIFSVFTMTAAADSLSGDVIKNTFTGKTAIGDHLKRGMGVRAFHATDGSYKSVLSDGTVRTGKWWVDGDMLCVKFDAQGKDKCRSIESDGKGGYKKIHPKKGKELVHIKSFEDGDTT